MTEREIELLQEETELVMKYDSEALKLEESGADIRERNEALGAIFLEDEFQNAVYADPDMTLSEMNQVYLELSREYGYVYAERQTEAYGWVDIPHTFQSPLYYISYATSALAALNIWTEAAEDRQSGNCSGNSGRAGSCGNGSVLRRCAVDFSGACDFDRRAGCDGFAGGLRIPSEKETAGAKQGGRLGGGTITG